MKFGISRILFAGVAVMIVAGGVGAVVQEAQSADPAAVRKALMKQNSAMLKNVKRFLKGHKRAVSADDLALNGVILAGNADIMLKLFPKGSGGGKTRAKAEIWQDWSGFKAAAATFKTEAMNYSKAAESGDKAAIKKAADQLGKVGCGGCHKKFRTAKKKKKKKSS